VLDIQPASYAEAAVAVEQWHYSRSLPQAARARHRFGVWEDGRFIGAVVYGDGTGPYLGLGSSQVLELARFFWTASSVTARPARRTTSLFAGSGSCTGEKASGKRVVQFGAFKKVSSTVRPRRVLSRCPLHERDDLARLAHCLQGRRRLPRRSRAPLAGTFAEPGLPTVDGLRPLMRQRCRDSDK
jgi:hypothetical protein